MLIKGIILFIQTTSYSMNQSFDLNTVLNNLMILPFFTHSVVLPSRISIQTLTSPIVLNSILPSLSFKVDTPSSIHTIHPRLRQHLMTILSCCHSIRVFVTKSKELSSLFIHTIIVTEEEYTMISSLMTRWNKLRIHKICIQSRLFIIIFSFLRTHPSIQCIMLYTLILYPFTHYSIRTMYSVQYVSITSSIMSNLIFAGSSSSIRFYHSILFRVVVLSLK